MAVPDMNPNNVILVIKDTNGKEVGRIAATSSNANAYLNNLQQQYGEITVDYVEDKEGAAISRLIRP